MSGKSAGLPLSVVLATSAPDIVVGGGFADRDSDPPPPDVNVPKTVPFHLDTALNAFPGLDTIATANLGSEHLGATGGLVVRKQWGMACGKQDTFLDTVRDNSVLRSRR